MSRPLGGYIGFNRVPAASAVNSAAVGMWTLREAQRFKSAGTWPYVIWVPTNLTGLQCWLDASDSTTLFDAGSGGSLPANGGAIGRWVDKSGTNNATDAVDSSGATVTSYRPTRVTNAQNSRDAINFGGTQFFDHNSAREMLRNRSCAIMAVAMKYGEVNNSLNQQVWSNRKAATGADLSIRFILTHSDANAFRVVSRRLDGDAVGPGVNATANPPYNNNWHVHVALCDWANGTLSYRIDGTQIGTGSYESSGNTSDTSLGTASGANQTWTAIGASNRTDGNNAVSSGTRVGEMLCHARTSGSYVTADVEIVEAYLAWKWGLEANLPVGHPYKSAPPRV